MNRGVIALAADYAEEYLFESERGCVVFVGQADARAEFGYRALHDQLSAADDGDVRTQALDYFEHAGTIYSGRVVAVPLF